LVPVTLQGLNTELLLVYFGISKNSIEEKEGDNIEKYVENKLHIKIRNKWKKLNEKKYSSEFDTYRPL
jgi:hypothetical protein